MVRLPKFEKLLITILAPSLSKLSQLDRLPAGRTEMDKAVGF